jgi:Trypsin-like peptidase domain
MLRALTVATLLLLGQAGGSTENGTLHIRAALGAAGGPATPIARHVLLISDNPASAPPRRIYTGPDGTADVSLKPGNYTVESDQPVTIGGRAYQWIQIVDITAGGNTTLELTTANAEVSSAAASDSTASEPGGGLAADTGAGADASASMLATWQNSVVGLWSPTAHGTGFLVEGDGLIVTSQRVVGDARTVQIQLDDRTKIAAAVLAADADQGVAVIAADPAALAGLHAVPVTCAGATTKLAEDQEVVAVAAPRRGGKVAAVGAIDEIAGRNIDTDLSLPAGSSGAPAFGPGGDLIGITTFDDESGFSNRYWRIVRIETACGAIAAAADSRKTATVPAPDRLPVETLPPVAGDVLAAAVEDRAGALAAYSMSTSDFDVAFITPPLVYAAREIERGERRTRGRPPDQKSLFEPLTDFANWDDYVEEDHAVLYVRATPKLVESFWATVGRYAAQTQGVALPAFKHLTSSFLRLQAFCGDTEVAPLHPFKLEQRLNEKEAVFEGFYAFAPDALGPQCGTVKLTLYSEKDPGKGDTKTVDPAILEKIGKDFAAIGLAR